MNERGIWIALNSGEITQAVVLMAEHAAPPQGVTNAVAWLIAVASTPNGTSASSKPLHQLAKALAIPAEPGRGLRTVHDLATAAAAEDWYNVSRLVARVRGAAPDTSRRQLFNAIDGLMRWDILDDEAREKLFSDHLTDLVTPGLEKKHGTH